MEFIGFLFLCLLVGIIAIVVGCFAFYIFILVISKIADILDIGCGCLGLIFIGFIVLVILGIIFTWPIFYYHKTKGVLYERSNYYLYCFPTMHYPNLRFNRFRISKKRQSYKKTV